MGADLLLAFVDVSESKQKWLDIIGEWNDAQVDKFVTRSGNDYIFEDILEECEDEAVARQKFVEAVNEALDIAYGNESRLVDTVRLDGKPWAVTGGPSWGDSPTDEFDDFVLAGSVIEYLKAES